MKPRLRAYQTEADYWRIREFLRAVFLLNDRYEYSWSLLRWDYWAWHVNMNLFHFNLGEAVHLWEVNEQIVGMVNPDNNGEAFFQVHPAYRSEELFCEMLDVAELTLPNHKEDSPHDLLAWVNAGDGATKDALARRGYVRSKFLAEYMRRRSFTKLIPDSILQSGYTIRALGDESELPARSWLSWKVFHPDEPDEKYKGWEWYKNLQQIPLYHRDLDIVAVAPDGELAAFCTV